MRSAQGARNHGLLNVSPDDFFATTHYFAPSKEEQDKVVAFLNCLIDRYKLNKISWKPSSWLRKVCSSRCLYEL